MTNTALPIIVGMNIAPNINNIIAGVGNSEVNLLKIIKEKRKIIKIKLVVLCILFK